MDAAIKGAEAAAHFVSNEWPINCTITHTHGQKEREKERKRETQQKEKQILYASECVNSD